MDKASVEQIAQRGVVGRSVLLDMARHRGKESLESGETFDHHDLVACAEAPDVEIRRHDVIVIRTNYLARFFEDRDAFYENFLEPGLTYSPELVQWFHDVKMPDPATDTIANEVTMDPVSGVALPLHNALMRNLGVTLTGIYDLEEFADDCAADGRFEFMWVAAPLKVHRAIGSSVNPLALK